MVSIVSGDSISHIEVSNLHNTNETFDAEVFGSVLTMPNPSFTGGTIGAYGIRKRNAIDLKYWITSSGRTDSCSVVLSL